MNTLLWILASTFLVSLIAFIGILTLLLRQQLLNKLLLGFVALSAGALMGGAFLHLIPEAAAKADNVFAYVLVGFVFFFLVEKVLHWRHCHKEKCSVHSFAYMNLFGDVVHNFIDGVIIAAAFVSDIRLGIATTFAIALHELPQELSEFCVLVYGGFGKARALFLNFVTALTAILGGVLGYYLSSYAETAVIFLLPLAAGGFIYIAASDLIPELRKEAGLKGSLLTFTMFVLGILLMYSVERVFG